MTTQLIPRKVIGLFTIYERKPKPNFVSKFVVFQGDTQVQDFSRYSVAVYYCKAQEPRAVPQVVVMVEGGLVREILSTVALNYIVLNGDAYDEAVGHAIVDPDRIEKLLNAIRKSQKVS